MPSEDLPNQTASLEVPLADKVLALLLLGSLLDSCETIVVTLGNDGQQGKHLTLEQVKSSLLNEEARRKDKEYIFDSKAFKLLTEGDMNRGRSQNRSSKNRA